MKNIDLNAVCGRLRQLRREKNLTQSQIAELLGTTQQFYSRLECGKSPLTTALVIQLAELFDVTTDYLLARSSERRPPERKFQPEEEFIEGISCDDFLIRIERFDEDERRRLLDIMNYLTYSRNFGMMRERKDKQEP